MNIQTELTENLHQQLLEWYLEAGADDAIGLAPINRYSDHAEKLQKKSLSYSIASEEAPTNAPNHATSNIVSSAHLAASCNSLEELRQAIELYDGCHLKKTCRSTVFADGNPAASLMIIGEAPGADEDQIGRPFVGASGKLLDQILASIGLNRNDIYITNIIPWRPPGNRSPEPAETALCLPFIKRHIELVAPQYMLILGGSAANALLDKNSIISKLRGRWFSYSSPQLPKPIPAIATYHPAYLLRTPMQKRLVWHDFLAIRHKILQKS